MTDPARGPAAAAAGTGEGPEGSAPSPLLLYDGVCGFCDGTVQFVLRRDPGGPMRFATLQGTAARTVFARHQGLEGVDSLILVERAPSGAETVSVRSEAILRLCAYLGGVWRLTSLLRIVPRPLRDWGYDVFARYRYRVFGRYDACPVPSAEVRARFLP